MPQGSPDDSRPPPHESSTDEERRLGEPLFFAMALDRAYGEVMKALTARGRLRTFNLLDEDWDFNGGTLSGYLDGTEDEALERRFYGRNTEVEILPWSFYGRLADTDGEVLRRLLSGSPGKCNILLYGVPGTGKTEFVKYLGQKLDRKVLVMKGSDLLSKYVGESEQNIAKAFRRAESEDEFDELKTLGNLAPGDFRTVRQEAFYLDEETSNADLIAALRAECLLKKDGDTKPRIGFAA